MDIDISFIIPIYNKAQYISECILSIISASRNLNYEILCVDDCSTDDSLEIIRKLAIQYSAIKIIKNESNHGAGYSRNRGLEMASGEYVFFVDGDDYIPEIDLPLSLDYMRCNDLDVLLHNMYRICDGFTSISSLDMPQKRIYSGLDFFVDYVGRHNYRHSVCGGIHRRMFLLENNLMFREGYAAEDAYFTLKEILLAKKIVFDNRACYSYRQAAEAVTTSRPDRLLAGYAYAYYDMLKLMEKSDFSDDVISAVGDYITRTHQVMDALMNSCSLDEIEVAKSSIESSEVKNLFTLLLIENKESRVHLSKTDIDRIKNAGEIYVYGSEVVARRLLHTIDGLNVKVISCLVSSEFLNESPKNVYGIPVVASDEVIDRERLTIVATFSKFYPAITARLNELGYKDVIYCYPWEVQQ